MRPLVFGLTLLVLAAGCGEDEPIPLSEYRDRANAICRESNTEGSAEVTQLRERLEDGGETAGASQPHKHLQVVPLPLADAGPAVPVEAVFAPGEPGRIRRVPRLPFRHAWVRLDASALDAPAQSTSLLQGLYRRLLEEAGISVRRIDGQERQGAPYNLLVAREWMLLVPRSRERFETVSVNALGFAGSLFLRNRDELRRVEQCGPMAVLRSVGVAT